MTARTPRWEPDPGWLPVPGGPSGAGTWRIDDPHEPSIVKRFEAPPAGPDPASDPAHPDYWRREVDVALAGTVSDTGGIRGAAMLRIEEDDTGATLWTTRVEQAANNGLFLARALGGFAGNPLPDVPWLARGVLGHRLGRFEERGGWPTLARTTLADVADRLWSRRAHHLSTLDAMPQVLAHGDPTPANLLGRDGEQAVAVDWSTLGTSAIGVDLGYLALSVREDLGVLVAAYAEAAGADPRVVRRGASVMACYTALCRAEWALARAARGPGALAGKYRHPAVAPYLRSLQRLFPELEVLVEQ